MRIEDILSKENILIDIQADTKEDAIWQLAECLYKNGNIADTESFYEDVLEREELGFTGIGCQTAIPHGISSQVTRVMVAIARLKDSVEWTTKQEDIPEEEKEVRLIILFVVPKENDEERERQYIRALKMICGNLAEESKIYYLMHVSDVSGMINVLQKWANGKENKW